MVKIVSMVPWAPDVEAGPGLQRLGGTKTGGDTSILLLFPCSTLELLRTRLVHWAEAVRGGNFPDNFPVIRRGENRPSGDQKGKS